MTQTQNKSRDKNYPPSKVLVIRFHAIGDIAASLPAFNGFREFFPNSQIDFLTSDYCEGLPIASEIFDNVYALEMYYPAVESSNPLKKLYLKLKIKSNAIRLVLELKKNSYDLIIDLQNNTTSGIFKKVINPPYYSEFDRYSPKPHSTRALETFQKAGFGEIKPDFNIKIKEELITRARQILAENGWYRNKKLVVLNPAGLWITRNWELENYVKLGKLLVKKNDSQLIVIGDLRIKEKAEELKRSLGGDMINLTQKTSLCEAFAALKFCSLVISEDSALAHMAWALGVQTILMLGSTRSDWTCHEGRHIICLNSSDLECGNCMQPLCKYGDVHCLTRYTPEFIYEKALLF
ncbi:MAG: glycosyltransferase family 9 protein [Chlorobi bacterium]|nr:glycosyltransferase family 9 protein [Chlorobiota bacterium]MCI0716609.1 glycosyltransferase family 9 protein [Chlorobiota bacterium]